MAQQQTEQTFNFVAEDQLQGLLMPPEATGLNVELYLGLFLLVCLLSLFIWRTLKNRKIPARIALKKIASLQKKGNSTPQKTTLGLVHLLCKGLGVKRLDQYQPENQQNWDKFHKRLNNACYSNASNTDQEVLFEEAKRWLQRMVSQ